MLFVVVLLVAGASMAPPEEDSKADETSEPFLGPEDSGAFIENMGQIDRDDIVYYTTGSTRFAVGAGFIQITRDESNGLSSSVRIEFKGSRPEEIIPGGMSDTIYNHLHGKDPSRWIGTNSYSNITVKELYPDIDMIIRSRSGGLKYDLMVHPGGDPKDIKISYIGADRIKMVESDLLGMECGSLELTDGPLLVYQNERSINADHLIKGNEVSFEIDEYDLGKELVIDPLLLASTYLGGNDWDKGQRIRLDEMGRPVVAATTSSTNFPTTVGAYSSSSGGETDIVVCRLSSDLSTLQVSTYLGGGSYDNFKDLDISKDGRIFLCGATNSTDFPTTQGSYMENAPDGKNGFIASLSSDLSSLNYSTYIGGSGVDIIRDIAVDGSGSAYVTGTTYSADIPTTSGAYQEVLRGESDTFLIKVGSEGTDVLFSTLIGGDRYGEHAQTVVVDEEGYPSIAGNSISGDYPTTEGAYKDGSSYYAAFLTRFEKDGASLNFSTYLANGTWINSMALGPGNDYFLTGFTRNDAGDFPVTPNAADRSFDGDEEAFLMRLSHNGTRNIYTTFLGADEKRGNPPNMEHVEVGMDVGADQDGRAYVCGKTDSNSFPVTIGAYDTTRSDQDCFLTIISTDSGGIEYSTFIGGSEDDEASGLALDGSKNIYVAGNTYSNYPSHDFPVTEGSYDTSFDAGYDGFILHFKLDSFVPSEPASLEFFSEDSFINLSWQPPEDDGGEEVIGYRVYRGLSQNTLTHIASTGAHERYYNDTGVTNGVDYLYKIKAFNIVGLGPGSDIRAMASTRPGAPSDLFTYSGNHHINLTWARPIDDGGLKDITYSVFMGVSQESMTMIEEGLSRIYHNITGLENGRRYHMSVRAENDRGRGPFSTVINDTPFGVPSLPLSLGYDLEPFKVSLKWEAPLEDGGSENITYRIYSGRNMSSIEEIESDLVRTEVTIPESDIGEQRIYFVRAENEQGLSKRSDIVRVTPLGDISAPYDLVADERGDHIKLQWERPDLAGGASNLTYTLFYGDNRSHLNSSIHGIEDTGYDLFDVIPGTTYYMRVRANNSFFKSPLSTMVSATPYTLPSEPLNLTGLHGDGNVLLFWDRPPDDGGDADMEYEVLMGTTPELLSPWRTVSRCRSNITSLKNGVLYYFAVRGVNIKGEGPFSNIVSEIPRSVPSIPRNLHYSEGDSYLNISWEEPMEDGGSENITYQVHFGVDEKNMTLLQGDLRARNFNITGLTNGVVYYFYVVAVNEEGMSERSDVIPARPLTYPEGPSVLNLTYTEEGVMVSWEPPNDTGGDEIWYYSIYRGRSEDDLTMIEKVGGSSSSFIDTDIDEDTTYYYAVSAETSFGEGDLKGPISIETSLETEERKESLDPMLLALPVLLVILLLIISFVIINRKRKRDAAMRAFFEE